MPPTQSERSAIARRAALTRASNTIGADISQPARDAFLAGFERPVTPGVSEAERQRQSRAALRAHMANLGRLSGKMRRQLRAAEATADELDQAVNAATADESI